jgi:hypothetical protein
MVIIPAARVMLEFDLGSVDTEPRINSISHSNSKIGLYSIVYENVEEVIAD